MKVFSGYQGGHLQVAIASSYYRVPKMVIVMFVNCRRRSATDIKTGTGDVQSSM